MIRHLIRLLAAAGIAFAASAHAQEINFGIISTDSTSVQKDKWEPLLADMRKRTGLDVKAYYAPDYNGVIEAMRFNKIQFAWFGNKSAMEAVDRANGEVFVRLVYADGSMGYYSLLITHKDSPLKSLDDVLKQPRQWSLGNGDPNSTSGNLVPGYYLWGQNNIDINTHFKAVRVGSHGANILGVLNHQVDVATNNTEELDRLKEKQPEKFADLRVLWKSPLIPSDPFVWRKDLPADVKAKIKGFLLDYGKTAEGKVVLKNIYNYGGFIESSDAQLLPIRQLELFKQRTKFAAADIGEADKKAKLAEIDAKLAELATQVK
jgi:phosphonate transport system substrate-binding protein